MKRFLLAASLLAVCSTAFATSQFPPKTAPDLKRGQQIATEQCSSCHAADGNSGIAIYPSLAGQHPAYIYKQFVDIRDSHRTWGMAAAMQPIVAEDSDQDAWDVANFMAKQAPKAQEADPLQKNIEEGRSIYLGGIRSSHVPACMSCHGPNGAGMPAGSTAKDGVIGYPRIASQHQQYVEEQLKAFRDGTRKDPIGMMNQIASRLTDEQIKAVSNFIQGLH